MEMHVLDDDDGCKQLEVKAWHIKLSYACWVQEQPMWSEVKFDVRRQVRLDPPIGRCQSAGKLCAARKTREWYCDWSVMQCDQIDVQCSRFVALKEVTGLTAGCRVDWWSSLTWLHYLRRLLKLCIQRFMGNTSQSYGASLAIWDHIVLPATRHKWTRPDLTPARQAGTRFIYPGGMEGWVDVGSLKAAWPGIEPTIAWSQVRRPNLITPSIRQLEVIATLHLSASYSKTWTGV